MLNYEIKQDLSDQRNDYLKYLLGVIFLGGPILLAFLSTNAQIVYFPAWLPILGGGILSYVVRYKQRVRLSAWCFLVGLLLTFALSLWHSGPSASIYLLLTTPVVCAIVLVDRQDVVGIAALSIGLIVVITVLQAGVFPAIGLMVIPVGFIVLVAVTVYINAGNVLEMIYWATDIQQKDTRRAEAFYEQKEQLGEALRQLTHIHSRLEMLNVELGKAQKKAERASQAKSDFLSNMSHELRTPLNVIIGYTSSMIDMPQLYDDLTLAPMHLRDIQLVNSSGYYLLGLINDILDLSKIEAGKLELHCDVVNLLPEFKGILATSIGLVKDKPIQIRPDFPDDLPWVWADPTRVRQIILNLMSNAIKFTKTGSVTLHAHVENQVAYISVIDTGVGIPEQALTHIFDRFEQAEHDTDKHYGGTGLGLDISKQLVLMHGSNLTVKSRLGQGSSFTFTLALATQQQLNQLTISDNTGTSVRTWAPVTANAPSVILLIEDEASLRDMMRRTLEIDGYIVVEIQDGAEAFEMSIGLLPDLIILDIRLPNIDGWQLLTSLKENTATAAIPVMVCTGSEDEDRARQLGADLYIRKPFSTDMLLTGVQELLPNSPKTSQRNTV